MTSRRLSNLLSRFLFLPTLPLAALLPLTASADLCSPLYPAVVAAGDTCPTINNAGNQPTITINGTLTGTTGLNNTGTIVTFTNNGTTSAINTGAGNVSALGVINYFELSSIVNTGTLSGSATTTGAGRTAEGNGIRAESDIGSITNSGTISGVASATGGGTPQGRGIYGHVGNIGSITNSATGTISGTNYGIYLWSTSSLGTLTNSGTIRSTDPETGNGINNTNTSITSITNTATGTIRGTNTGIYAAGTATIGSITNAGTIGGLHGILTSNTAVITTITNTGSILPTGGLGVYASITNGTATQNSIVTLNNLQSNLSYRGPLPLNYNIIINSPAAYGKVTTQAGISGATTFGIYAGSTLTATTYASVLSGFAAENLNVTSGTYGAYSWSLVARPASVWDLVVSGGESPGPSPSPSPSPTPAPLTNINTGGSFGLSSIGVTTNPVFAGGTLALGNGASTSQPFTVTSANGLISVPTGGTATMTGPLSGPGGLGIVGGGTLILAGNNTYSGGTEVFSNTTLSVSGNSPTGTGTVLVDPNGVLMGTGTIAGLVQVGGILKPGNSPGYLATTATVTMNAGSTYLQDIAGRVAASPLTPVGATAYYAVLNVTGGQFVINAGSTLSPRLQNLFQPSESGYGSAPYVPAVGDRFRIITADGGITGKFSSILQPAGMAEGTTFVSFYNQGGSNSVDLAVVPSAYGPTSGGNTNARSVGAALDRIVALNQTGTSTGVQDSLLYNVSAQSAGNLGSYLQGMAGELYAASLAVVPQATLRVQQAVVNRLGDVAASTKAALAGAATNAAPCSSNAVTPGNPGGMPTASAGCSGASSIRSGAAWGEIAYQYGNRGSDSNSGGWTSNLYQAVVGVDLYSQSGTTFGGGVALSQTSVSASQGSSTVQQGSLFLYGKMPVGDYSVDGMASYGANSTNNNRNDVTGITNGLSARNVSGNDALVSAGISRSIELEDARVTPYLRATWQGVSQGSFNEGSAVSALSVNSYNNNGVRGVLGVAVSSKAQDPIRESYTYKGYVAVGADTSNLVNPTLNASIVGISTQITTPSVSPAFAQAGVYGTAKIADSAFAYVGLAVEARGGQTLGSVNGGIRIQF